MNPRQSEIRYGGHDARSAVPTGSEVLQRLKKHQEFASLVPRVETISLKNLTPATPEAIRQTPGYGDAYIDLTERILHEDVRSYLVPRNGKTELWLVRDGRKKGEGVANVIVVSPNQKKPYDLTEGFEISANDLLVVNAHNRALSVRSLAAPLDRLKLSVMVDDWIMSKRDWKFWPHKSRSYAGAYVPDLNTVLIPEIRNRNQMRTVFHEIGHAWARFMKLDKVRSTDRLSKKGTALQLSNKEQQQLGVHDMVIRGKQRLNISERLGHMIGNILEDRSVQQGFKPFAEKVFAQGAENKSLEQYDATNALFILQIADAAHRDPTSFFAARRNRTNEGIGEMRKIVRDIDVFWKRMWPYGTMALDRAGDVSDKSVSFGDDGSIRVLTSDSKNYWTTMILRDEHRDLIRIEIEKESIKSHKKEILCVDLSSSSISHLVIERKKTVNVWLQAGTYNEDYAQKRKKIEDAWSTISSEFHPSMLI